MDFPIEFASSYKGALARLEIEASRLDRETLVASASDVIAAVDREIEGALHTARRRRLDKAEGADHRLFNRLNTARLSVAVAQRRGEDGQVRAVAELLRVAVSALANGDLDPPPTDRRSAGGEKGERATVLLVEDEPSEAELLGQLLEASDFACVVAASGLEALRKIREQATPAVVLVDMFLPKMDGVMTVRSLRSNPHYADIPVFALSGADQPTIPLTEGPEGFDRWFSKPVDAAGLVEAIREVVRETMPG